MIPKLLVPGTRHSVSRLILGTVPVTTDHRVNSIKLLDAYHESGGNAFDFAYIYHGGKGHAMVAEWAAANGIRNELVYYDKGSHPSDRPKVTPEDIESDMRADFERLGQTTMEFWAFHRDNREVAVGPLVDKLNELKRRGWVDQWGCSNWHVDRIEEFNDYAASSGQQGFAVNNPNLSLATVNEPMWADCHTIPPDERSWHERTQFPLFSWSSTGGGYFAGADSDDVRRVYDNEENQRRRQRAARLGGDIGVTANQVALAWTLCQPYPVWALIGPADVDQLKANVEACQINLTGEQLRWLEEGD